MLPLILESAQKSWNLTLPFSDLEKYWQTYRIYCKIVLECVKYIEN